MLFSGLLQVAPTCEVDAKWRCGGDEVCAHVSKIEIYDWLIAFLGTGRVMNGNGERGKGKRVQSRR